MTETKDKFQGLPLGARAVQIADGQPPTYFLDHLRPLAPRNGLRLRGQDEPTLSQALHLLNGDTVQNKIREGGVIERLLAEKKGPEEIVRTLYVRCLSREPAADEFEKLKKLIEGQPKPAEALEDIFWSLLNSREFCFNH